MAILDVDDDEILTPQALGAQPRPQEASSCAGCGAPFSRLSPDILCSQCSKRFCYNCATETVPLPNSTQTCQVCDDCYFELRDKNAQSQKLDHKPLKERILSRLPPHWRSNVRPLADLAGKSYYPRLIESARLLITMAVVGHVGLQELCGCALGKSMIWTTQTPVSSALVGPLDDIISKILALTPEKAKSVGLWIQRSLVLHTCAAFLVALTWQTGYGLWTALGADADLCEAAMSYLRLTVLGVMQEMILGVLAVWMLAQGYELPHNTGALISLPVHVVLNLVIVYGWGGGLQGVAWAEILSRTAQLAYTVGHIYVMRLHDRTWAGWSLDAFIPEPLLAMGLTALPCAAAGFLLTFSTQVPLLLSATLGIHIMGPFVCMEYLCFIFLQPTMALSNASLFKISKFLKTGNGRESKGTAWLSIFSSLAWGIVAAVAIICLTGVLVLFFSHESRTVATTASLMPLAALWQVWNGLSMACFSVLESAGAAKWSLFVQLSASYAIIIPLSMVMLYFADLGVLGLLWSIVFGQAAAALKAFFKVKGLNWAATAELCRHRALQRSADADKSMEVDGIFLDYYDNSLSAVEPRFSVLDEADDEEEMQDRKQPQLEEELAPEVQQVRSVQLYSIRYDVQRSRALSSTVLRTYIGQWIAGKVSKFCNLDGYTAFDSEPTDSMASAMGTAVNSKSEGVQENEESLNFLEEGISQSKHGYTSLALHPADLSSDNEDAEESALLGGSLVDSSGPRRDGVNGGTGLKSNHIHSDPDPFDLGAELEELANWGGFGRPSTLLDSPAVEGSSSAPQRAARLEGEGRTSPGPFVAPLVDEIDELEFGVPEISEESGLLRKGQVSSSSGSIHTAPRLQDPSAMSFNLLGLDGPEAALLAPEESVHEPQNRRNGASAMMKAGPIENGSTLASVTKSSQPQESKEAEQSEVKGKDVGGQAGVGGQALSTEAPGRMTDEDLEALERELDLSLSGMEAQ